MMLAVKQVQCLLLLRVKNVLIKTVRVSVSERLMEAVLKTVSVMSTRGFKSYH